MALSKAPCMQGARTLLSLIRFGFTCTAKIKEPEVAACNKGDNIGDILIIETASGLPLDLLTMLVENDLVDAILKADDRDASFTEAINYFATQFGQRRETM